MPVNESEAFVGQLCGRSFLVPWAYLNPTASDGRELADALVVHENDVIIMSVKEYNPGENAKASVARERWVRKTVDSSVKQLMGALRRSEKIESFVEPSSKRRIQLPPLVQRRVHLVSISLGGSRLCRLSSKQRHGGFVHQLDDQSFVAHFVLLDTINEFLAYLEAREQADSLTSERIGALSEEDWLGSYLLSRNRLDTLPRPGAFEEYVNSAELRGMHEADPAGYFWDRLIVHLWSQRYRFMTEDPALDIEYTSIPSGEQMGSVLRQLAVHPRPERRFLGSGLFQLLMEDAEAAARVTKAPTGPGYVFQKFSMAGSPESANKEFVFRCMYAQEILMPDRNLIGLLTTEKLPTFAPEVPILLTYLEGAVGSPEMKDDLLRIAKESGTFQNSKWYEVEDEKFGIDSHKGNPSKTHNQAD